MTKTARTTNGVHGGGGRRVVVRLPLRFGGRGRETLKRARDEREERRRSRPRREQRRRSRPGGEDGEGGKGLEGRKKARVWREERREREGK